eukprot:962167-Lingulodinium_polyedra.AAC.1
MVPGGRGRVARHLKRTSPGSGPRCGWRLQHPPCPFPPPNDVAARHPAGQHHDAPGANEAH